MFVPVKWKVRMKDYKFYNEKYYQGLDQTSPNNTKFVDFKFQVSKKELISKCNRLLTFTITVNFMPNSSKFVFDGECVIESPDQNIIKLLIDNSDSFRMLIEYNIFKKVYPLVERMAKEERLLVPPSELVIKDFREDYFKRKKKFDKKAQGYNKKHLK